MSGDFIAEKASADAWLQVGLLLLGIWIVLPLILFVLGRGLGSFTLRLARQPQRGVNLLSGLTRLLYSTIVALSVLYFYLSIPLVVIGASISLGAAIEELFLTSIPAVDILFVQIFLVISGFFIGATFLPVFLATFLSGSRKGEKLRLLRREEAPQLWDVVEEVTKRAGTRSVDSISIVPGTNIGVSEAGGLLRGLRSSRQRVLMLGFGALPEMSQGQFKAILAHEYAHFSNRDMVGGRWAYQTRIAVVDTMRALEEQAVYSRFLLWLPVLYLIRFLIRNYYNRIFLPITIGASRIHEILADRYAAEAYGGTDFGDGLMHIVRQEVIFNLQFDCEEKAARKAKRRLYNLYTLPPLDAEQNKKADEATEKILNRPTAIYDTHPAARARIRLVEAVAPREAMSTSKESVWTLFQNADALQMEMTGVLQAVLYSHYGHSWAK